MTQILERLCRFDYLTVIILGEDVILNEPVENWPSCHCLISFHSKGWYLRGQTGKNGVGNAGLGSKALMVR